MVVRNYEGIFSMILVFCVNTVLKLTRLRELDIRV